MKTISISKPKPRVMTILAGVIGNTMEWYDFAIYGFFAPTLGRLFFPSADATTSLIASFGAFAAGFLMRPVGGAIFGYIGDRLGRKRALNLSVLLMALPTFAIGLLPTYAQVGTVAAIALVILRMLQGISVGGEYTSSIVYLAECAPPRRRGIFSSASLLGAVGGVLMGSLLGTLISGLLTEDQMNSWGWRIPFLLGILVAYVGFLIRRHMPETISTQTKVSHPLRLMIKSWRTVLTVGGLNLLTAVGFYTVFVFIIAWLVNYVHESRTLALQLNSYSMLVFICSIALSAWLSDLIGRRPVLMTAAASIVLLTYPLISLIHHKDASLILAGQMGMAILLGAYFGPLPATLSEMFPANIRVSAVSVGYNLTYAIFGGTTPMLAVWLIRKEHNDLAFVWYIILAAAVSLYFVFQIRPGAHHTELKD